jgi:hypothetical protein
MQCGFARPGKNVRFNVINLLRYSAFLQFLPKLIVVICVKHNMIITRTIYDKAADFSFSTAYKGNWVNLTIIPDKNRFIVLADGELFGHIKIGYERHTWYVANSNYVEYEFVKEIGQMILSRSY